MASKIITSPMYCRHCGYNLYGLPEPRCAECGRAFDSTNRKTFFEYSGSIARRRWIKRILITITATVLLVTAAALSLCWPWHREQVAIQMVHNIEGGRLKTKMIGSQWLKRVLGQRVVFF